MTITGSGQISIDNLSVEFGLTSTSQNSLADSFSGYYCQNTYYSSTPGPDALGPPYINRNTAVGRTISSVFAGSTNYAINQFYSYNDSANFHWSYQFTCNSSTGVDGIIVTWTPGTLYSSGLASKTTIANNDVDTGDFELYDDIYLELVSPFPNYVDVRLYDTDTNVDIYYAPTADPNSYRPTPVNLGTIYGFQRFSLDLFFYD